MSLDSYSPANMSRFFEPLLFLSCIGNAVAAGLCPILGPAFPPFKHLSSSVSFKDALANLTSTLDEAFATGTSPHGPVPDSDTYSIQIFSTEENVFEYYHKGLGVVSEEVNGDSVYRMASTTKLYAVYMLLVAAGGDAIFSDPVTKYFTELKGTGIWDEVTVGAVAGQVGGVTADRKHALESS